MIYNSKVFAFLLSVTIAVTTTAFVWLMTNPGAKILVFLFLLTFIVGLLVSYVMLDRFLFRGTGKPQERMSSIADGHGVEREGGEGETARLRKLETLRNDLIADVSHELKTPIFAAQGFVHTLLDGTVKKKALQKKFLKKAAKSLDRLDMLVQDLLTLSQIETGKIKMRFEHFDLYTLTEEILEPFTAKAKKKGIVLRIEGPARSVTAYGDAVRIGQVMSNLISNAIKHSSRDSEVVVSFDVRKKSVVTHVRDFGEGIPAEHINRVFERFYRVDKSRSRDKGGTGLGLAIVKHILEGHHTRAEVESTLGKGTTFSFKLPVAKSEENGNGEHNTSTEE